MRHTMNVSTLPQEILSLYNDYSHQLSDDSLEAWVDLFGDEAEYRMTSRRNHEMHLPLCTMLCESKGAIKDRVTAIRNTLVYAPRKIFHVSLNAQLIEVQGDAVLARSQFMVWQTFESGSTELQMVGRSFDTLKRQGERLRFAKRMAIFDTELIPGSAVYPV